LVLVALIMPRVLSLAGLPGAISTDLVLLSAMLALS